MQLKGKSRNVHMVRDIFFILNRTLKFIFATCASTFLQILTKYVSIYMY